MSDLDLRGPKMGIRGSVTPVVTDVPNGGDDHVVQSNSAQIKSNQEPTAISFTEVYKLLIRDGPDIHLAGYSDTE